MTKRKLKRQLGLIQIIMLGTAGTIAAEIFVLTGHAAGMAGPAAVFAVLLAGLLSYSIALNYCEMAVAYPVTGGAMTYVREAWGTNVLSFLVGSFDCLSSTFYAALSAVGFAYSLQVFIPWLPIVPTALAVVAVFILLNVLGVNRVGGAQIVLGAILLGCLGIYVVAGFASPMGFRWQTVTAEGWFTAPGAGANLARMLATIALVYNAYVGFEVIADDAEEAQNPARNIPAGILISLTATTVIYSSVTLVTLGVIPWRELAGSETALTDAIARFLPGWGVPMMAVAGMIATLTSVNSAMLSATREAFTLSRDGQWPAPLSWLSRFRTPYMAIIVVGLVVALVAAVGLVDFLSYISSSGYLFVLFFSNLAMVRLRKRYPDLPRPFKVPFFPLTPYLASGSCLLIIAFSQGRALLFGAGLLAVLVLFYYLRGPLSKLMTSQAKTLEQARDRILIPVANPRTAESLAQLAFTLAEASEDTSVCVLTVLPQAEKRPRQITERLQAKLNMRRQELLDRILAEARRRNAPLYTKLRFSPDVAQGVLDEVRGNVRLVLMGWPGPLTGRSLAANPVKVVLQKARAHVAVLLDRGLKDVRNVLVPVGGGFHSRLAIRLGYEIARSQGARLTALQCYCEACDTEELEDRLAHLDDIVVDSLGSMPPHMTIRLAYAPDVVRGVLEEARRQRYDLIVVGASEQWVSRMKLFGSITDHIAEETECSVLLVRRHEGAAMSWLRRQVKQR